MKISINIKIILPLTTILLSATNSNGECYEKNQGLINAVLNGNEEEVKYLLQDCIADVNTKEYPGYTPLILAIVNPFPHLDPGNVDIIKLLLQHNADVNSKTDYGETALILSASRGQKDVVKLLLEYNADITASDNGGYTALIGATASGGCIRSHWRMNVCSPVKSTVEHLLQYGADVNHKSTYGNTALIWAASRGYKDIVEVLLEHNADGNTSNIEGYTALISAAENSYAAENRYKDIVELLLQYNVDINLKTEYGYTALMLAAQNGHKDIVNLLLANGADTHTRDYVYGRSAEGWAYQCPFYSATKLNCSETFKLLFDPESSNNENSIFWQYSLSGWLTIYNEMKQVIPPRFLKLF